jgi:hypothetical protein
VPLHFGQHPRTVHRQIDRTVPDEHIYLVPPHCGRPARLSFEVVDPRGSAVRLPHASLEDSASGCSSDGRSPARRAAVQYLLTASDCSLGIAAPPSSLTLGGIESLMQTGNLPRRNRTLSRLECPSSECRLERNFFPAQDASPAVLDVDDLTDREASRSKLSVLLDHWNCQSKLTAMDSAELSTALASEDPATGFRSVLALRRLAERVEAAQVVAARGQGWSWQQIGDALGITRQSVHAKYGK